MILTVQLSLKDECGVTKLDEMSCAAGRPSTFERDRYLPAAMFKNTDTAWKWKVIFVFLLNRHSQKCFFQRSSKLLISLLRDVSLDWQRLGRALTCDAVRVVSISAVYARISFYLPRSYSQLSWYNGVRNVAGIACGQKCFACRCQFSLGRDALFII